MLCIRSQKENLTALFQKIAAEQELYLPVEMKDR